jgi:hypothetical protein
VILYNLLSAYKRVGLPEELHSARPKRLRFLLLNTVGKVVRHARETLLRCAKHIAQALAGPPRTRFALKRPALAGVLFMNPALIDWRDLRAVAGNLLLLLAAICWAAGSCLYQRRPWQSNLRAESGTPRRAASRAK